MDHPRIRGEHQVLAVFGDAFEGSSPHTRGAPCSLYPWVAQGRIIPAYAGSTSTSTWRAWISSDHPRIRGEHPIPVSQNYRIGRIIPAYAGSTGSSPPAAARKSDHPRIRGEHLAHGEVVVGETGSSPHTRGAHHHPLQRPQSRRIIPAYAGSTLSIHFFLLGSQDHPRIRGEHMLLPIVTKVVGGSSPHTRGALNGANIGYKARRIIPAYAGSTETKRWPARA